MEKLKLFLLNEVNFVFLSSFLACSHPESQMATIKVIRIELKE